jgi:hypothetical protein
MTGARRTKVPLRPPARRSRLRRVTRRLLIVLASCVALGAAPLAAQAKGGGPDVRVSVRCGSGATAELRLRDRDGAIRTRFEVDHARAGTWNVVLVHERRIGWKGSARIASSRDSFELERTLPNYPGSDSVTARATGPRGVVCQAIAVLPEVANDGSGAEQGDDS